MTKLRVLNVGCGRNKYPGAVGIDRNPNTAADVLCDLDRPPYPFAESCFDQIRAVHVIEHVQDVMATMKEFHRLARPGGTILVVTPHYTDFSSFCDPTHRWHLSSFSFRHFGDDHGGYDFYTEQKLKEHRVHVRLLALWRWMGFEFLVNHSRRFRLFWEHYLCTVVRGKVITFEFEVLK